MACNCKHNEKEIESFKSVIAELRELFIKRMTVDSDHNDSRRKDFNQAIFMWWNDEENRTPEQTFPCFSGMDMSMVLKCFDDAVRDWRRTWCDVENCRRK